MKIDDYMISSDFTRHTATRDSRKVADLLANGGCGDWSVSWLPGRALTRNQAITAMTIAEAVKTHTDDLAHNQSQLWGHIDGWAAELGLSGPHAVAEASICPEDHGVILEAVRDADQVVNVRFLVTTAELGRAGTKVHISAHGVGSSVDTAPFAVTGLTVRVSGGRSRGDAMAYFADIVAELNAALNPPDPADRRHSRLTHPLTSADVPPGMTPLPLELEGPEVCLCGHLVAAHTGDGSGTGNDRCDDCRCTDLIVRASSAVLSSLRLADPR